MTVDKVTIQSIFGDDLTVEEWEEAQNNDRLGKEVKELYPIISGEYVKTIPRGLKAKFASPKTKLLSGRYLSPEEIKRRNDEMAAIIETTRKAVFRNLLNRREWLTAKELCKGSGLNLEDKSNRGTASAVVARIFKYLDEEGLVERRRNPDGAGKGYVFMFSHESSDPKGDEEILFKNYVNWEKKQAQLKRSTARGESGGDNGKGEGAVQATSPDPQTVVSPQLEEIRDPLTDALSLVKAADGATIKVNVEFNVNVRFGLIRE